MKKFKAGQMGAVVLVAVVAAAAASCSVDTSKITFDDDLVNGSGGNSSGSGGSGNGEGGDGGDGSGTGGSATGGSTGACEAGTLTCEGQQVKICIGGALVNAGGACLFACSEGACVGTCVPDDAECLTNKERQTCSALGEWSEPKPCGEHACVDGACVGVCEPGDYTCGGTNDGMPQLCSEAGEWVDQRLTNCGEDKCTNGICVGGCTPGEKQCAGALARQFCDTDETWQPDTPCPYVCSSGTCVGECVSGSTQCISNTEKESCGNGFWGTTSTCQFVCDSNKDDCGGECLPDSTQCSGNVIQACNDSGAWKDATDCAEKYEGGQCIERGGKVECGVCTPGERRCNINTIETCAKDGLSWGEPEQCDNVYACLPGEKGPECVKVSKLLCATSPDFKTCTSRGDGTLVCTSGNYALSLCEDGGACLQNNGVCLPKGAF